MSPFNGTPSIPVRRIGIIGAGNTGLALAAHAASLGFLPLIYTRHVHKAMALRAHPLCATGMLHGEYQIEATTSMATIMRYSDCIFIATWANAHRSIAQQIVEVTTAESLDGTSTPILVLNGNWGAYELFDTLHAAMATTHIPIAESTGMPYVAQQTPIEDEMDRGPVVHISGIKNAITIAYAQRDERRGILDRILAALYADTQHRNSIFATSLAAPNPIIHAPLCLLNLARIESGGHFHMLVDGFTNHTELLIHAIDDERHELARHVGVQYTPILDQLNGFWNVHYASLQELFSHADIYSSLWAPTSINHRFIQEDVPYGLDPLVRLGHTLGVPVPTCEALLRLYQTYLGLPNEGPQFSTTLIRQLI